MSGLQNIVKVVFITACIAVLFYFNSCTCYAEGPVCGEAVWGEVEHDTDGADDEHKADKNNADNTEFVMTDELYMDIYNEIGLNEVQYGINRLGMEDISFNAIFSGIKNNDFNYV